MTRKKLASATPATPIAAELSALPATDTPHSISFPIAGIGASAGGLAAFEAFFPGMPIDKDPDMAFLNGMLQLLEPAAPRGQRLPIDRLCYPCLHERYPFAVSAVSSV